MISEEISRLYFSRRYEEIMILGQHSDLDPLATIHLVAALALLGRGQNSLLLLGTAYENESDPDARQMFLSAMGQICDFLGRTLHQDKCYNEAEMERKLGGLENCELDLHFDLRPQLPHQQVRAFCAAGGLVEPLSYSAACQRDFEMARKFEAGEVGLLKAVEEFGPWHEILRSIRGKPGRNWLRMAERKKGKKEPGKAGKEEPGKAGKEGKEGPGKEEQGSHESTAGHSVEAKVQFQESDDTVYGRLQLVKTQGELAVAHFLCGNYQKALEFCCLVFPAVDTIRSQFDVNLRGVLQADVLTLAMVAVCCLEMRGESEEEEIECDGNADGNIDNNSEQKGEKSEKINRPSCLDLLVRLVHPGQNWKSLSKQKPEHLQDPLIVPSLSPPLRKSQYFLSCGHILRRLAQKSAVQVKIGPGTALCYYQHQAAEIARKYIVAAACHPLDDPAISRLYDRVLWSVLLCGGVHLRTVWFFFVVRNRSAVAATFAPVAISAPAKSMWPRYTNGPAVLDRLFDLCQDAFESGDDVLAPLVFEMDGEVRVSDDYYTSSLLFGSAGGFLVRPHLRPHLRVSQATTEKCVALSCELVQLWISVYREHHGEIPGAVQACCE